MSASFPTVGAASSGCESTSAAAIVSAALKKISAATKAIDDYPLSKVAAEARSHGARGVDVKRIAAASEVKVVAEDFSAARTAGLPSSESHPLGLVVVSTTRAGERIDATLATSNVSQCLNELLCLYAARHAMFLEKHYIDAAGTVLRTISTNWMQRLPADVLEERFYPLYDAGISALHVLMCGGGSCRRSSIESR